MRNVFTDEVARELGYQKQVPELKDWIFGVFSAVLVLGMFACGIVILVSL